MLCMNYRLPVKYETKWAKPGKRDLLKNARVKKRSGNGGWQQKQLNSKSLCDQETPAHSNPYSQPCVRNMFSSSFVLQQVKNHIVFIKKYSENLSFKFNKKAPQENLLCHTISPCVFEANDEVWLLTMRIWSPLLNPELYAGLPSFTAATKMPAILPPDTWIPRLPLLRKDTRRASLQNEERKILN